MTRLSRKERREQGGFTSQYNGKAPISFAEYIEGFKNEKLIPRRLRNHPLNKAVKA